MASRATLVLLTILSRATRLLDLRQARSHSDSNSDSLFVPSLGDKRLADAISLIGHFKSDLGILLDDVALVLLYQGVVDIIREAADEHLCLIRLHIGDHPKHVVRNSLVKVVAHV